MSIDFNNMEDMSIDEILSFLDAKRISADKKREEIKKLRSAIESTKIVKRDTFEDVISENNIGVVECDDDFDKEVEFYLSDFLDLKVYDKESIEDVLPSRSNYNYERIVLRIMAEITHDIKDIREIIISDSVMDKDDLEEYKEELLSLTNKRDTLREILLYEEDEIDNNKQNTLIFLPIKGTEEFRIFDELKSIPQEEYAGFLELFESIKNGTFKNIRRFINNKSLNGAIEVKGHNIRVVFQRLSKDCYGIVSMFMKKTQNNNEYRSTLINRYTEFKSMEKELKEKIKDQDFILKNKQLEEKLFAILSSSKVNEEGGCK